MKKHKPNLDDLRRLEWSTTFDDLPDSREIKCYLHCLKIAYKLMNKKNNNYDVTSSFEFLNAITNEERKRYMKMYKKCNRKYDDLYEMAYQITLCEKRNSNKDFYTFWKPNLDLGP